jgi:carbonic anhydrase
MTDFRPVWNQQSPIALDTAMSRVTTFPKDYLAIDYPNEALPGFFAEHNFWFDKPPCMSLDGHAAKLERLHIHSPSEHHVDGTHFPFEIHFVNKFLDESGDSKAVVIGAFFEELSGAQLRQASYCSIEHFGGQPSPSVRPDWSILGTSCRPTSTSSSGTKARSPPPTTIRS